ncbi:hypothetical protein SAMN04488505_109112 [Chitinophaga rupis]|uniref:Uncharacterized protein n=2 Tax=Chitinophaga rupis TaxID=573321 RepID=A0A1H8F572_9BACT|nr:hypothetical protein SAMN04488505_109112 [Chitinophaga rupis]
MMSVINKILIVITLLVCLFSGMAVAQKVTVWRLQQMADGTETLIKYDSIITRKSSALPPKKTVAKSLTMAAAAGTSCTCTCLKPLFDYLIASHRLFIPATDNILVSTLVQDANDAGYALDYRICNVLSDNINKPFFALTTDAVSTVYKARIGDCVVSLKSLNSNPVNFWGLVSNECTGDGKITYQGGNVINKTFQVTEAMTLYNISQSDHVFTDPFYTTGNVTTQNGYQNLVKDTLSQKMVGAYEYNKNTAPEGSKESYTVFTNFRFGGVENIPANAVIQTATLKLYAYPGGFMPPVYPNAHTTSAEAGFFSTCLVVPGLQWHNTTTSGDTLTRTWLSFDNFRLDITSHFQDITFNALDQVNFWKQNENRGFSITSRIASGNPAAYGTFCSQRYSDPAKRPALDVTYVVPVEEGTTTAQLQVDSCYTCTTVTSGICYSAVTDVSVNPYVYSLAGNWRPYRAYTYYDTRATPPFQAKTNIRQDGQLPLFIPFWNIQSDKLMLPQYDELKWVWNSESTLFNRKGFELENKDPLGRYNTGLYGYDYTLPVAVVQNSRYRESAFDGFEDYFFEPVICDNACASGRNFDFSTYRDDLDTLEKHTGKYSLRVAAGTSIGVSAPLVADDNNTFGLSFNTANSDCGDSKVVLKSVRATADALLPVFSPLSDKQVLVSAWVKEAQDCHCQSYANSQIGIVIEQAAGNTTVIAKPSGNIIEGWQRIEQVVNIPAGATRISINLQSTGSVIAHFDDVRVHPFNANMKSFVYNPVTLRLMAELDENNYATFYEYDDDGTLIRLKKETERGIKTIKETRTALLKEDQ